VQTGGETILKEILNKYFVSFGWSHIDHDRNKLKAIFNSEMKIFSLMWGCYWLTKEHFTYLGLCWRNWIV